MLDIHTNGVFVPWTTSTCLWTLIWWMNSFGVLTGYSLVLVHYIGTGKLWQIRSLPDQQEFTVQYMCVYI